MAFIERPYQFKEYPKIVTHAGKRVTVKNADEEAALLTPNVKLDPPVLMVRTELAPVIETKVYEDGTQATGVAPLPDQSPAEQEMLPPLDQDELTQPEVAAPPAAPVDEFKGLATNHPTPVLQTRAKRQAAQQAAEAAKARKK